MVARRGAALGLAAAVACVLTVNSALADDVHAFRLTYAAPAGCPDADTFSKAILASGARAHRAVENEPAVDVSVLVAGQTGGFMGALALRRPDGTETSRAVPAPTCEEVTSAMALIVAITVDPDAARAHEAGTGSVAAFEAPPAPPPVAPPPPPPPPVFSPLPPPAPPPSPPSGPSAVFAVGAGFGALTAVAPTLAPEVAFVNLSVAVDGNRPWAPLFALSGRLAESVPTDTSAGTAQFERLGARLAACPVAVDAGRVTLRPCAFGELGRLHAKGENVTPASTANVMWRALGVTARGDVDLVGPLMLSAELGAIFPLLRDSFHFDPGNVEAHHVPAAGFVSAIDLAVKIP